MVKDCRYTEYPVYLDIPRSLLFDIQREMFGNHGDLNSDIFRNIKLF